MEKIVSIPEEQVGNLVGRDGRTLRTIEKCAGVHVESLGDGTVRVSGDSIAVMKAADVVEALGMGFRPGDALELFQEDCQLLVMELSECVPESQMERVQGRIIGRRGKVKKHLEDTLGVHMQVTDQRVAAIGVPSRLQVLREVLEHILGGATHASAYKHMDKRLASLENI